jgi:hypothetical protein
MRKMSSFLTVLLLTFLTWGTASAADLPTISPADGSADVWYHIRLEQRIWGIGGSEGTTNGGSIKGYYYDRGRGEMLENIEEGVNEPGTQWKVVATATEGEYKLISRLGNTIDYSASPIGTAGSPGYVKADRYYTTTPGSQVFTIKNPNGDYLGLTQKGVGGIDKSNQDLYFDKYGPDEAGGAITFVAAEPLTEVYLISPGNQDFSDVPSEKSRTKTLEIAGINLPATLSYSISGAGFTYNAGTSTATGGTVDITFAPTEKKAYTASLTITAGSKSITVALTGNADFEFPIKEDQWYYIQFERQAVNNKVLQADLLSKPVTQAQILGNENKQLWKIVGTWDEYHIVNKTGELEIIYNTTSNQYDLEESEFGNEFGFERFKDTGDWQLRNLSSGYYDEDTDEESTTQRYFNDYDNAGKSASNYYVNDAGNRLVFIPATTQALVIGQKTVDFGSAPAGTGASVKKTIPVGGLNTTGAITGVIKGTGTAAFSLKELSLPAAGGAFEVTFTPATIDIYKAILVLSSPGVANDTVQLTARGSTFPFTVSSGTNEHWYYIQFMRQPGKALTSNGSGETVTQEVWSKDQELNNSQLWKITGTWDNYKFVSKTGGELLSNPTVGGDEGDYDDYVLGATGNGHIAVEKTAGTNTGWVFQNVAAKEAEYTLYMNDKSGSTVCLYSVLNDDGNPLKFIPASGTAILPDLTTLAYDNVTIGLKGEKTLTVSGTQLTTAISYTLTGSGAASFKVTNTTANSAAGDPLPKEGGTLKISFEPEAPGDYIAVLTLRSTGAPDVVVVLSGNCVALPDDFPVKISNATSTTWYTVYFDRRYTDTYSWKVWTAGLTGETIKQTAQLGRTNPAMATEEQLWKFVVAPSKTGYLVVSNSGLEATFGDDYILGEAGEGTPLVFAKNPATQWVLKNNATGKALNDRGGSTVCEYSSDGADSGCPLGFIETPLPAPVRIQLNSTDIDFGKIEAGAPALYSGNLIVKGVGVEGNISIALSGEGASAFSIIRAADSTAVSTISQADTLKIIFNPANRQIYRATITFTATGATTQTVALTAGGDLTLPAKPSTAAEPVWYYIGFVRQSPLFNPPKTYTRVLTVEADTLMQRDKAEEAQDTQLWRIEGTPATGYQLISKTGVEAVYDSLTVVRTYLLGNEGDYFTFVSGRGDNAGKIQMRNLTNDATGGYFCDKDNKGVYARNYSKDDAGNWLTFTPLIPTAIIPVEAAVNDPVTASAYYNLQGIRIQQPVRGNVYIRVDTHASKKTTATKIFLAK